MIIGKVKFQSSFVHEKQSSDDIDNTRGMNQCLLPLRRDALVLLYQIDDKVDVSTNSPSVMLIFIFLFIK